MIKFIAKKIEELIKGKPIVHYKQPDGTFKAKLPKIDTIYKELSSLNMAGRPLPPKPMKPIIDKKVRMSEIKPLGTESDGTKTFMTEHFEFNAENIKKLTKTEDEKRKEQANKIVQLKTEKIVEIVQNTIKKMAKANDTSGPIRISKFFVETSPHELQWECMKQAQKRVWEMLEKSGFTVSSHDLHDMWVSWQ